MRPPTPPSRGALLPLAEQNEGVHSGAGEALWVAGCRPQSHIGPTYLAVNGPMFRASVLSERLLPATWGVHLLGNLTPSG
jgi:hypothetical protein